MKFDKGLYSWKSLRKKIIILSGKCLVIWKKLNHEVFIQGDMECFAQKLIITIIIYETTKKYIQILDQLTSFGKSSLKRCSISICRPSQVPMQPRSEECYICQSSRAHFRPRFFALPRGVPVWNCFNGLLRALTKNSLEDRMSKFHLVKIWWDFENRDFGV